MKQRYSTSFTLPFITSHHAITRAIKSRLGLLLILIKHYGQSIFEIFVRSWLK